MNEKHEQLARDCRDENGRAAVEAVDAWLTDLMDNLRGEFEQRGLKNGIEYLREVHRVLDGIAGDVFCTSKLLAFGQELLEESA